MTSELGAPEGEVGSAGAEPHAHGELRAVACEVLQTLLSKMGVQAHIEARVDTDVVLLEVQGQDTALIIGRKGGTLEALQLVTNKLVRRRIEAGAEGGSLLPVIIDVEGYRERRNQGLLAMALQLADKVQTTGRTLSIMGMRAADRRVLHLALSERPDVASHSEGEGRGRQLLLTPREPESSPGAPGRGDE